MSQTTTMPPLFFPDVAGQAVFDGAGPRPQFLVDSAKLTVVVAGLDRTADSAAPRSAGYLSLPGRRGGDDGR